MDVEKEVIRIIDESLFSENKVVPGSSLVDDLGADSLDCIEIIMAVDDELGVEIPEEEAEKFKTVQDIISFVERQLK